MTTEVVESLKSLSEQDLVTIVIDGEEYNGFVSYYFHNECEYIDGIPNPGSLSIDIELDSETVKEKDLPTHQLEISIKEKRPDQWEKPLVHIWTPEADENGYLIENEYTNFGDIEEIQLI